MLIESTFLKDENHKRSYFKQWKQWEILKLLIPKDN